MSFKKKTVALALSIPLLLLSHNYSFADDAVQMKREKEAEIVEVRENPNRDSKVLGEANQGTIYDVIETKKGWYKIKFEDTEGFVPSNFFSYYEEMTLKEDTPVYGSKDSNEAIDTIKKGEKILLLDPELRNISYIRYKDKLGFVKPENLSKTHDFKDKSFNKKQNKEELRREEIELIQQIFGVNEQDNDVIVQETNLQDEIVEIPTEESDIVTDTPTNTTKEDDIKIVEYNIEPKQKSENETPPAQNVQSIAANASAGQAIVNEARKYIGYPYVWGGESLTGGVDCSGFTMLLYRNLYGISMPHLAASQAGYGQTIPYGQQRAGDLVFFGSSWSNIWHVAIATDEGTIVHASNPSEGIKEGPIYQAPFVIKRIVE